MLGRRNALERVASFLHALSERYRALGRNPHAFVLPMRREDIASYLGLVIETVSRSFTKLQEDSVIAVSGRKLKLLDPARLEALVHAAPAPSRSPSRL